VALEPPARSAGHGQPGHARIALQRQQRGRV